MKPQGLSQIIADQMISNSILLDTIKQLPEFLFELDPETVSSKLVQLDAEARYSLEHLLAMEVVSKEMLSSGELVQDNEGKYLGIQVVQYFMEHFAGAPPIDAVLNGINREILAGFFDVSLFQLNQAIVQLEEKLVSHHLKNDFVYRLQDNPILVSGAVHREYILPLYHVVQQLFQHSIIEREIEVVDELIAEPVKELERPEYKLEEKLEEKPEYKPKEKPVILFDQKPKEKSVLEIEEIIQKNREKRLPDNLTLADKNATSELIADWIRRNPERHAANIQAAKDQLHSSRPLILKAPLEDEENDGDDGDTADKMASNDAVVLEQKNKKGKNDVEIPAGYEFDPQKITNGRTFDRLEVQLPQPKHWLIKWADVEDKYDYTKPDNKFIDRLIAEQKLLYTPLDFDYAVKTVCSRQTITQSLAAKLGKALALCMRVVLPEDEDTADNIQENPLQLYSRQGLARKLSLNYDASSAEKKKFNALLDQLFEQNYLRKIGNGNSFAVGVTPSGSLLLSKIVADDFQIASISSLEGKIKKEIDAVKDIHFVPSEKLMQIVLGESASQNAIDDYKSMFTFLSKYLESGVDHMSGKIRDVRLTQRLVKLVNKCYDKQYTLAELYALCNIPIPAVFSETVLSDDIKNKHGKRGSTLFLEELSKNVRDTILQKPIHSRNKKMLCDKYLFAEKFAEALRLELGYSISEEKAAEYITAAFDEEGITRQSIKEQRIREELLEYIITDSMPCYVGSQRFVTQEDLDVSLALNFLVFKKTGKIGVIDPAVVLSSLDDSAEESAALEESKMRKGGLYYENRAQYLALITAESMLSIRKRHLQQLHQSYKAEIPAIDVEPYVFDYFLSTDLFYKDVAGIAQKIKIQLKEQKTISRHTLDFVLESEYDKTVDQKEGHLSLLDYISEELSPFAEKTSQDAQAKSTEQNHPNKPETFVPTVKKTIELSAEALNIYNLLLADVDKNKIFPPHLQTETESSENEQKLFSTLQKIDPSMQGEITSYYYLVQKQARYRIRKLPSSIELDDLISAGTIGLIDGLQKYNPVKNDNKEAYLKIRINGAIADYLRNQDFQTQRIRRAIKKYDSAVRDLEMTGVHATDEVLAAKLNLSLDDFHTLKQSVGIRINSLDSVVSGFENRNLLDILADETHESSYDHVEKQQSYAAIAVAVTSFKEKHLKQVFNGIYIEGKNMKEVGSSIGVTESRISQLHKELIPTLKAKVDYYLANYRIIIPFLK